MDLILALAAGLLLLGAGLSAWRHRRRPPAAAPEPLKEWRLAVARDARFPPESAAAWFAALAPLLDRPGPQPWVELRSDGREASLRLAAPAGWEPALRGQLAAWFPGAALEPDPDPGREPAGGPLAAAFLTLEKPDLYPLRTAPTRGPDPLLSVLGALGAEPAPCGVRLRVGPPPPDWKRWAPAALAAARAGQGLPIRRGSFLLAQACSVIRQAASAGSAGSRGGKGRAEVRGLQEKAAAPVFAASVAAWAAGGTQPEAEAGALRIAGQLQGAFADPSGNAFRLAGGAMDARAAATPRTPEFALSAAELGSLFHLPHTAHPLVP